MRHETNCLEADNLVHADLGNPAPPGHEINCQREVADNQVHAQADHHKEGGGTGNQRHSPRRLREGAAWTAELHGQVPSAKGAVPPPCAHGPDEGEGGTAPNRHEK